MDIFLEFLKLGFVGLIAGLFSAFLTTRNHRNSKSWEIKVSAYRSLIDELSDLAYSYDKHCIAYENGRTTRDAEANKEYLDNLNKLGKDSFQKVRKATDSGVFLYSEEINKALREFMKVEKQTYHDLYDHLQTYSIAADKCRNKVVELASKEFLIKYKQL